jgi:DNA-cytosine methyltransferase
MRVLSLFSGVGGFDMGLEAAGMTTVFQCEIDKHARSVLDYHWPDVPKWDDVSTLTGAHILEVTGGVDVVAWGSPCQDLSLAGKRAGLSGERSGLFHQGIRIIKELRELSNGKYPTWSIWENVVGALSSNGGADFGEVLHEMDEAGACFSEWTVLDAQYFGVPQRRRRVFVTSCFDSATSERCGSPLFPVCESVSGDSEKGSKKKQGASRSTQDRIGTGGQWAAGSNTDGVLTTSVTSKWHKGTGGPSGSEHYNLVVEPSTFVKSRRAQSVNDHETWVESDVTPTLNVFDVGDVRATTAIVEPILLDGRRVDDVRVYSEPVQTLQERMGTGGNNVPVVAQETILLRNREGKPGGGKGPLISEDISLTLGTSNDQTLFQTTLSFDTQFGSNANVFDDQAPTLKASQQPPSVTQNKTPVLGSEIVGSLMASDYKFPQQQQVDENKVVVQGQEPTLIVRRLTPLECTRLMGWRDDHLEIGTLDAPDQDYARQVVRHLWRGLQQEAIQRHTRGFWEFLTPEILLSAVRLGWISWDMARQCAASAREIQGENAWPESFMRLLSTYTEHRPSPHRREPFEQLAKELNRPLPFLSSEMPQETQGLFYLWVYEQAQGSGLLQQALASMEKMGRPFIYQNKVAPISDTNRYKMCGNGIASPVAQWIAKHILATRPDAN